jgi:membrane protease YdiL (CAAX protease family)
MDSLSQSTASPAPNEAASTIEPSSPHRVAPVDLLARLALFVAVMFALVRQLGPLPPGDLVYPLLVYGLLTAGYLLVSVPVVAAEIRRQAEFQPLLMSLAPLILLLPVIAYARAIDEFDPTELLFTGVLVLLPAACAVLNVPQLRRADVSLGLITAALPILLPFARSAAWGEPAPTLDGPGVALRIGAFVLPVLLLLLTNRDQKERLNFLFLCAVLSIWYSVEFGAFTAVAIEPSLEIGYFEFAAIPLFLYVLAMAGRFDRLGLAFQPTPRGLSVVSVNFAMFAVIAVPIGLFAGFLTPQYAGPTPIEAISRALMAFLLIALPQEILFRGTLLTHFEETLRVHPNLCIAIVSVIFGASHLNNPPNVGWYVVLATLAGVFYARAFLATRNVVAAATVHAAVIWAWWLLFNG